MIDEKPNTPIRMMHETRKGCTPAREAGWRQAIGEVIVHVDADETFPSGWMARIHEILQTEPDLGAFGGIIRFDNAPPLVWLSQMLYNQLSTPIMRLTYGHPYLCGGMTVVRREVLEAMNGYADIPDDKLDDAYLSSQATERGYKIKVFKDLWVWHSLRRYEEGGIKAFLQWGAAAYDTELYQDDIR